jgi:hypothetical protein
MRLSNVFERISRPSYEPLYATNPFRPKHETFLYEHTSHWALLPTKKTHNITLLFGSIILKHGLFFEYRNQPLNMHMRICYLDCHEVGLCCYLVINIENLLRSLQLFYFHLWPIYWLPRIISYVRNCLRGGERISESGKCRSSSSWDITPCSPLEVNQDFGGTSPLSSGLKTKPNKKSVKAQHSLRSRWWRRYVSTKRRLTFNGLHDVVSQKIELFITTGVRTSNPTQKSVVRTAVYSSRLRPL